MQQLMSVALIYDDIKDELQSEQTERGKELETKTPEETTDKRMSRQTDRQTEWGETDKQIEGRRVKV